MTCYHREIKEESAKRYLYRHSHMRTQLPNPKYTGSLTILQKRQQYLTTRIQLKLDNHVTPNTPLKFIQIIKQQKIPDSWFLLVLPVTFLREVNIPNFLALQKKPKYHTCPELSIFFLCCLETENHFQVYLSFRNISENIVITGLRIRF